MLVKNAVPTMRQDQATVKKLSANLFTLLSDPEEGDEEDQAPVTVENLSNELIRICAESLEDGASVPDESQTLVCIHCFNNRSETWLNERSRLPTHSTP
jgi:hypothetical protein